MKIGRHLYRSTIVLLFASFIAVNLFVALSGYQANADGVFSKAARTAGISHSAKRIRHACTAYAAVQLGTPHADSAADTGIAEESLLAPALVLTASIVVFVSAVLYSNKK